MDNMVDFIYMNEERKFITFNRDELLEKAILTLIPLEEAEKKNLVRKKIGSLALAIGILCNFDGVSGYTYVNMTWGMLRKSGISAQELFARAEEHSLKVFSPIYVEFDVMHVVTTAPGHTFGAVALFYPGMLKKMQEILGGDYYILPSSRSEMILVRKESADPEFLRGLVKMVNETIVEKDRLLGNDIFLYSNGKLYEAGISSNVLVKM